METVAASVLSRLADEVLQGHAISREEALGLLQTPDTELRELLTAAFRIREAAFGRSVKVCVLQNARSGLCPEDCHYCSQSKVSNAEIPRYRLLAEDELVQAARHAVASGARRYCMVTSGRGPSEPDLRRLTSVTRAIKQEFPELEVCVSLGIMSEPQARELKDAGVG